MTYHILSNVFFESSDYPALMKVNKERKSVKSIRDSETTTMSELL